MASGNSSIQSIAACGVALVITTAGYASPKYERTGLASWYGQEEAGHRTASGRLFDPSKLSAAHRTLPLGACVRVTNFGNRRTIVVPIIDRGPFVSDRVLDLSQAAAERLDMVRSGFARVRITLTACPA